jgi:hypothetical protein
MANTLNLDTVKAPKTEESHYRCLNTVDLILRLFALDKIRGSFEQQKQGDALHVSHLVSGSIFQN